MGRPGTQADAGGQQGTAPSVREVGQVPLFPLDELAVSWQRMLAAGIGAFAEYQDPTPESARPSDAER